MRIPLGQEFRTPMVDKDGVVTAPWQKRLAAFFGFDSRPLPVYANNAAAIAGGLKQGDWYRTGGDPDVTCVVH